MALKNIGIYALHDTLASTTAKDDGKQVVYDCSHASTWLRHPNMLPLRGGWQATECVRNLRQKHKNNFEMECEQKN